MTYQQEYRLGQIAKDLDSATYSAAPWAEKMRKQHSKKAIKEAHNFVFGLTAETEKVLNVYLTGDEIFLSPLDLSNSHRYVLRTAKYHS